MSYKTLAIAALSSGSIWAALAGPSWAFIPLVTAGTALGYTGYELGRKTTLKQWTGTGLDLVQSVMSLGEGSPEKIDPITIDGLPDTLKEWLDAPEKDLTTPEFWEPNLVADCIMIAGGRGSGKSELSNWVLMTQLAQGFDIKVSDLHYDREESSWCRGMAREDFESKLLVESVGDTYTALMHLQSELAWRIENKRRDLPKKGLLIDECGGFFGRLSETEQNLVVRAIDFILDEGRKYGIILTLVFHRLTQRESLLSEGARSQFHIFLMGDAVSNTTWVVPASISGQRANLVTKRAELTAMVNYWQRVIVYRHTSGDVQAVVSPDWKTNPVTCQVVNTKDELRAQVEPLVAQGMGITAIAAQLGITRGSSGQYPKLQEIVNELKGVVVE